MNKAVSPWRFGVAPMMERDTGFRIPGALAVLALLALAAHLTLEAGGGASAARRCPAHRLRAQGGARGRWLHPARARCAGAAGKQRRRQYPLLACSIGHSTFHAAAIEYRGRPIHALPVHERSRLGIGYVPQTRDIFPSLAVEENLAVAARPGRWPMAWVYDMFPRLAERRSHFGKQISDGEQQIRLIGRALMGDPSLLLPGEPLEGLAPLIAQSILLTIRRLIEEEALSVIVVDQSAKPALLVTQRRWCSSAAGSRMRVRARSCWPTRRSKVRL